MAQFYNMQRLPKVAKGINGQPQEFSVPVLLFDKDDPTFCEIGHYDFKNKTWTHFGEMSLKLICWCYIPNPTNFLKNKEFEYVIHEGYRP